MVIIYCRSRQLLWDKYIVGSFWGCFFWVDLPWGRNALQKVILIFKIVENPFLIVFCNNFYYDNFFYKGMWTVLNMHNHSEFFFIPIMTYFTRKIHTILGIVVCVFQHHPQCPSFWEFQNYILILAIYGRWSTLQRTTKRCILPFSLFWGYQSFPAFLGPKGLAYVVKGCHFV